MGVQRFMETPIYIYIGYHDHKQLSNQTRVSLGILVELGCWNPPQDSDIGNGLIVFDSHWFTLLDHHKTNIAVGNEWKWMEVDHL